MKSQNPVITSENDAKVSNIIAMLFHKWLKTVMHSFQIPVLLNTPCFGFFPSKTFLFYSEHVSKQICLFPIHKAHFLTKFHKCLSGVFFVKKENLCEEQPKCSQSSDLEHWLTLFHFFWEGQEANLHLSGKAAFK